MMRRAERKAGQLLREMEKAKGRRPEKPLSELGISYDQSSRYQRLAQVPAEQFEHAVKQPGASSTGIIARHAPPSPSPPVIDAVAVPGSPAPESPRRGPVDDRALWVWGRLKDFERDGVLAANPDTLIGTMTEIMVEDTRRLAPLVAEWLGEDRIKADADPLFDTIRVVYDRHQGENQISPWWLATEAMAFIGFRNWKNQGAGGGI